jgi:hypothetical protein
MNLLRAIAFTGVAWALAFGTTWVVVVSMGEGAR